MDRRLDVPILFTLSQWKTKMTIKLTSQRFNTEQVQRVSIIVPDENAQTVVDAVLAQTDLKYGDYDRVTFKSAAGIQSFRSLGSGRNRATEGSVEVPCTELTFVVADDSALVTRVIEAVFAAHPYEEPVIHITPSVRTLHIRGLDEDNPNRFWNAAPASWVPNEIDD